jgi:hypothetical protein
MRTCSLCTQEISDDDKDVFEEITPWYRRRGGRLKPAMVERPSGKAAHGNCVRKTNGDTKTEQQMADEQVPGQEPLF